MRLNMGGSGMRVAGGECRGRWNNVSKTYTCEPPMSSLHMYSLNSSTYDPISCTQENVSGETHSQDFSDSCLVTHCTGKRRHITSTSSKEKPAWESSSPAASEDESVSSGHKKMGLSRSPHSHHNLDAGGGCQVFSPRSPSTSHFMAILQEVLGASRKVDSLSSAEKNKASSPHLASHLRAAQQDATGTSKEAASPPSVERSKVSFPCPTSHSRMVLQDATGTSNEETAPPSAEKSNVLFPRPPASLTKGIFQETSGTSREETSPSSVEKRAAVGRVRGAGVLMLLLLLASPASGRYDKGGPQHSITWGRGNSPSSAVFASPPTNVTAVRGHRARLPCQVKNLGHKDVSWIRQRDLHILTVGIFTYTTDDRFKVHHTPETEDWHLDISSVTFRDSGVYECQVSTSPKASLPITLTVLGQQEAVIRGPREVYVQKGSTISLECEVKAGVEAVGVVRWFQGSNPLNYSSPRGGISMEVEKTPSLTTSRLHITRAGRADSGNYTCHPLLARPSSVTVHVVSAGEESAAAVQSACVGARACATLVWACVGVVWAVLLTLATQHLNQPHPPHPPS